MPELIDSLFAVSPHVRYVATLLDGKLAMRERAGLANTSASESDKYEELIVNPAVLELVTRRGNIDCGGAQFVVIRYGNFWQSVYGCRGGHVSIGMELAAEPLQLVSAIQAVLKGSNRLL